MIKKLLISTIFLGLSAFANPLAVGNDLPALKIKDQFEKELKAKKLKGIPDTEITLQSLALKKDAVEKIMQKLASIRHKKIVDL